MALVIVAGITMLAADNLDAALIMGVTVTLAIITPLVIDHFGLKGSDLHKAGVVRVLGGALMI